MIPVEFEGTTHRLGAPKDWDEEAHGPCMVLPIATVEMSGLPLCISTWQLTGDEKQALIEQITSGFVRLGIRCRPEHHPVVSLWVE